MSHPAIDQSILNGLLADTGDPGLVDMVVDAYRERAPQLSRTLDHAVFSGARAEAALAAHDLASLSGQVGAISVAELARQIERAATKTDRPLGPLNRRLQAALHPVLEEIDGRRREAG